MTSNLQVAFKIPYVYVDWLHHYASIKPKLHKIVKRKILVPLAKAGPSPENVVGLNLV
jgi:NADH:ubiquinone oxidoreductase subunit